MAEKHKWCLFYIKVSHIQMNLYAEIKYKGFGDELDMLVWASEMHIPRKLGLNWVVSSQGIERLPVDLYERIDQLKKVQCAQEEKDRIKQERADRKVKAQKEWDRRQKRKAKQAQKEAVV